MSDSKEKKKNKEKFKLRVDIFKDYYVIINDRGAMTLYKTSKGDKIDAILTNSSDHIPGWKQTLKIIIRDVTKRKLKGIATLKEYTNTLLETAKELEEVTNRIMNGEDHEFLATEKNVK